MVLIGSFPSFGLLGPRSSLLPAGSAAAEPKVSAAVSEPKLVSGSPCHKKPKRSGLRLARALDVCMCAYVCVSVCVFVIKGYIDNCTDICTYHIYIYVI